MLPVIVILAGGRATRMDGADKGLLPFADGTMLGRMLARLDGQGSRIAINANGDPGRYAGFGLPVIADSIAGQPGPLAGILTGMEWVEETLPEAADIVTVPADTPFLPRDLVARLIEARVRDAAQIAVAQSAGRRHPVAALWPLRLKGALRRAITRDGARRVDRWAALYRIAPAEFATDPVDPFFNVNFPEELAEAERLAGAYPEA
jgi:molybdopterin-guanine dinucleotide biosynthesis protein A